VETASDLLTHPIQRGIGNVVGSSHQNTEIAVFEAKASRGISAQKLGCRTFQRLSTLPQPQ
jgi:hypothetical protein